MIFKKWRVCRISKKDSTLPKAYKFIFKEFGIISNYPVHRENAIYVVSSTQELAIEFAQGILQQTNDLVTKYGWGDTLIFPLADTLKANGSLQLHELLRLYNNINYRVYWAPDTEKFKVCRIAKSIMR